MDNVTAVAFEVNNGQHRAILLVNTLDSAVSVTGEWPTTTSSASTLTLSVVDPDNGHGSVPRLEMHVDVSPPNGAWKVTLQPYAVAVLDDAPSHRFV